MISQHALQMAKKIFPEFTSILFEYHNKLKEELLIDRLENDDSFMHSALSKVFHAISQQSCNTRVNSDMTVEESVQPKPPLKDKKVEEGNAHKIKFEPNLSDHHRDKDLRNSEESEEESYSDFSFIPESEEDSV